MYLSGYDLYSGEWSFIGVHIKGGGVCSSNVIETLGHQGFGVWERPDRVDIYKKVKEDN